MQGDQKRKQGGRVVIQLHAEQGGNQQGVAEAADREQLGDALQDAQQYQQQHAHPDLFPRYE